MNRWSSVVLLLVLLQQDPRQIVEEAQRLRNRNDMKELSRSSMPKRNENHGKALAIRPNRISWFE